MYAVKRWFPATEEETIAEVDSVTQAQITMATMAEECRASMNAESLERPDGSVVIHDGGVTLAEFRHDAAPKMWSTVTMENPVHIAQVTANLRALLTNSLVRHTGNVISVSVPEGTDPKRHAEALADVVHATNVAYQRSIS